MPRELIAVPWDHILYDYDDDRLLLTVSCGRSATFSVKLFLSANERRRYRDEGAVYIEHLAQRVRRNPDGFSRRDTAAEKKLAQGFD